MPKKKRSKAFWNNIKFKYKLTIINENTLEEVVGLHVSKLNGLSVLLSVLTVLFLFAAAIITFTPLRNYLPGYMNSDIRAQVVENALRVDSLQQLVDRQNMYIMNIQDIFSGTVRVDTVQSMDSLTTMREDSLIARSEREEAFRRQYEETEKYNLTSITAQPDVNGLIFYRPTRGMISDHFDAEKKHFGTDIAANPNESVLATLDGTVILSTYTAETGYLIEVQHNQDFVSVYKHCGSLLKREGDTVKGGEAIALVGNSGTLTTGPHLHFELWHRGRPVNQIAILGSTGSIGTQALQVIEEHPELYEVYALTANNKVDLLIAQARKFMPEAVVIANEEKYAQLKEALSDLPVKVYAGAAALCQIVESGPIDVVLTTMVGYAGLKPTMNAIRAGKAIALANKETLVVAGELINQLARQYRTPILPVDSEHSAVFQCLAGEVGNPIEKVILTASGGPFRTCTMEQLKTVTKVQALKHPNWEMGAKITIDSASMMNKGFEVIEAKWLFGVQPGQIEVVVHPQSVIHSMVQFEDGAIKAQLGMPDMRLPIQYAFSYPDRINSSFDRLDFSKCTNLTFEQPDTKRFRNLALAYESMYRGGNMPCIVNAANEVVVAAFLRDEISFLGMSDVIEHTMGQVSFVQTPTYDDYVATDAEARRIARELICK